MGKMKELFLEEQQLQSTCDDCMEDDYFRQICENQ